MQINRPRTRQYLRQFNFQTLFVEELGWDHHTQTLNVAVGENAYTLAAIAEKRGMVAFECQANTTDGGIPEYKTRRKIQRQVARSVHENFVIYTDTEKTTQIWQWARREHGRPIPCYEHEFHITQPGNSLIEKLERIAFSFEEEGELTLFGVLSRVLASFKLEKVTKRFYDHFKREHAAFLKFLNGIPDQKMKRWYVSVVLNRLMFIYFIQKKGFLDNDPNYLRTKLAESKNKGKDLYYKEFLCPLFFEGFAKNENDRPRAVKRLLGKVPYLNGSIFQQHQLEVHHGERIQIPDNAFETLFSFFEQYQWHLDDRHRGNDNEINPDVLGYIFEKYINEQQQKQMGAYYTPEDITDYISKNTIIPSLFDTVGKACKIAVDGDTSIWKLLQENPDRYIYKPMKKGVELELPTNIDAGIDDVSKRTDWNTLAPSGDDEYALPTEIWREVFARRQRYKTVRSKLANGEITDINALITYNLDIRQFAQGVIENCEDPEMLHAFWDAINKMTILDPTCGSGAFLLAATNILEPLYEACLNRMQAFVDELSHSPQNTSQKIGSFCEILERVDEHPNRKYLILKSIIINNLYGVDNFGEAIEICKLRLFLKMVANLEDVKQIEPLPDIDFNIQEGNTLVGYTSYDEVEESITSTLNLYATMNRIKETAEDVDKRFEQFRLQQTKLGGGATPAVKRDLQDMFRMLEDELNDYLARGYGVDPNKHTDYQNWLISHKPFHWFIAFYGILKNGGFDVIIGNPPYVGYSKVKKEDKYTIKGYETESCDNLYAFVFERSFQLLQKNGWKSMIIPVAAFSTDKMSPLQDLFHQSKRVRWVQTYAIRPTKLFVGAEQRLAIYIIQQSSEPSHTMYSSRYHRWHGKFREHLFAVIEHAEVKQMSFQNSVPKVHSGIEQKIWNKLFRFSVLERHLSTRREPCTIYFHSSPRYWIRVMDFVPYFWNEQDGERISTSVKPLHLVSRLDADAVVATLNSSLFYWWFVMLSECRSLSSREIRNFPIGVDEMEETVKQSLSQIASDLMEDYKYHARRKETYYRTTGRVVYDEFYPRHSKSIIDEIDSVLKKHYGFTDEELDFIINYDIKYRMGLGN